MPESEATAPVATVADTDTCPVCATVVPVPDPDGDAACPRCGLVVRGGPRLGPVTDELRRRLDERRQAAARGLEALAVVRAAGYPGTEDQVRLLRLARLVGGPPLTETELGHARRTAAATRARLRRATSSPQQAALSALGARTSGAAECHVILVGRQGLGLRIFAANGVERAVAAHWSWPQLLGNAPQEADARLFWLAGRVGPAAPEPGMVAEAARRWADREAVGWSSAAVLRRDPGWMVPDVFTDALAAILATRTLNSVPDFDLAPDGMPDDWRASIPVSVAAWGMAPGYPAPGQAALVIGTLGGDVAIAPAGPAARDTGLRTVLQLRRLVTAVAAGSHGILAGSVLGDASWAPIGSGRGDGREPVRLPSHSGRVSAAAVSPRMLLTLGSEGRLHRIRMGGAGPDLSSWATVEIGSSGATALAAAERSPLAVTGGADGILRVVDTELAERTDIRLGAPITAVAIDPGGRLAVVGHGDGSVAVVTLADGASRVLFAVAVPPASPLAVAFGDADASVVAADATGLLTAWSGRLASGDGSITRLGRHAGGVGALRHLGQASVLAAGRQDGVLSTWPLPGREPARPAMEGEKA